MMNLKQIILEEMGDFDWIKNIKPTVHELVDSGVIKNGDHISVSGPFDGDSDDNLITVIDDLRFTILKLNRYVGSGGTMMIDMFFVPVTDNKKTYDYMVKNYGELYSDGLATGLFPSEVRVLNVNWIKRGGETIYEF